MLVRPHAGALPAQQRQRSQSTPPRRRANSTGSALVKEARAAAAGVDSSPSSSRLPLPAFPPPKSHPIPLATSPKQPGAPYSDSLLRSVSGKRKLFRLKRPSSSNADTRAAREREGSLHVQVLSSMGIGLSAIVSPPASPSAPPRPPRNPARGNVAPRAPSPTGPPPKISRPPPQTDTREMKASGDAAADWEFPLPRGSEFPLQRKKSKSSKFNTSRIMQEESAKSDIPFSTVDRTILEELRQKIRAREEQFVNRSGRKYHAFPPGEVPYPRSYDRQVVDMDVWDDLWQLQLGASLTMHVFKTPPARVLDLGCGTGTWILNAAREWKGSYFVGVDVVPLHPDLLQVGCFDLAARITWVQANFLERLPFPNEEFDYVRVTRVSRGVPEDKWDGLFEEITRVMKPGGAFEIWEEDLQFPGSRRESVSIIESFEPLRPPTPPRTDSSHSSEQDRSLLTPTSGTFALPMHRSMAYSYSFDDFSRMKPDSRPPLHSIPSSSNVSHTSAHTPMLLRNIDRPPINPHDHSLLEAIYNEMHSARFINLEPLALIANMLPLHFRDVKAPPPIVITFPMPPVPSSNSDGRSDSSLPRTDRSVIAESDSEDHSRSQVVESPTDVPPGSFIFPTVLHARDMAAGTPFVGLDSNRFNAIAPSAFRRATLPGATNEVPAAAAQIPHAFPPHENVPMYMTNMNAALMATRNPLPNKTVNFDPRSLNLILALRVAEVLGCAEPMWDWVVDFQESVAQSAKVKGSPRVSDGLVLRTPRRRRHPKEDALLSLTRTEFDAVMRRFELDMKSRMYLGAAVEDRLGWGSYPATATEERDNFDAMCQGWAEYEQRLTGATVRGRVFSKRNSSPVPPPPPSRRSDPGEDVDVDATVRGRVDPRAPYHAHHAHHAHSHTHITASPHQLADLEKSLRRKSAPARKLRRPGTAPTSMPSSPASIPSIPSIATSSMRVSEPEPSPPPCSRTGRVFVAWKA